MLILEDNYSSNSTCHPSNCVFFLFLLCFETVFRLFLFREACEMFRFFLLPYKNEARHLDHSCEYFINLLDKQHLS